MILQGEPVLVTGGTSFLGRHVAEELAQAGANVIPVGKQDCDLRQRSEADALLETHRPSMVVHLAVVEGGVEANRAEPGRFFYENALMGIELLEACRVAGVDKILVAGTASSYPRDTPVPFVEDALWNGLPDESNAPYALAKKMLLVQANAYRRQYGMNIIYLVPGNMYGPHDNFDPDTGGVIPAMITKFVDARDRGIQDVTLWGDGTPTREFVYVADAARAFRLALERYDQPQPVNIGSGDEIMIRDLAKLVQKITAYDGRISWDTTKPNGQARRSLYTSLAKRHFDFEATTPLEDGLRETVAWYQQQRP